MSKRINIRFFRRLGLIVCTLGGAALGAAIGAEFAADDAQIVGTFGGLSAGYGLFATLTGSY